MFHGQTNKTTDVEYPEEEALLSGTTTVTGANEAEYGQEAEGADY